MCILWRYISSWHLQSPSFPVGSKQMVEAVHSARQYSNNPCMTSCRTWKLQILPELCNLFQHLFAQLNWSRPTCPRPSYQAIRYPLQETSRSYFLVAGTDLPDNMVFLHASPRLVSFLKHWSYLKMPLGWLVRGLANVPTCQTQNLIHLASPTLAMRSTGQGSIASDSRALPS